MHHLPQLAKLLFVLYFTSTHLFSQSVSFKNYQVDDGLPTNTVYSSFQDSKGFMWFGSESGVSKYDGYRFTNFTTADGLSDNEVFNFFEDSSGKIWFETLNGNVSYYKNGEIINSARDTTLRRLDSQSYISAIAEGHDGSIWISTLNNGIVIYTKDKSVHRFFNDDKFKMLTNIEPLGKDKILMITHYGVYKVQLNEKLDSVLKVDKCDLPTTDAPRFSKSVKINDSTIWFSHRNGGWVYSYNMKKDKFDIIVRENPDSVFIFNLCKDNKAAWVCTNKGATSYSVDAKKKTTILRDHRISSLLKDREGNYWVTSLGDGIFFCTSGAMYCYTVKEGLASDKVNCLAKDSLDRIWLGYEKGMVSFIRSNTVNSLRLVQKSLLNSCRINKIHFYGDRCWVASTEGGLFLIRKKKIEFLLFNIKDVVEYPKNHLWLGSGDRILTIDRKIFDDFKADAGTVLDTYKLGFGKYGVIKKKERTKSFFIDSRSTLWVSTERHVYFERGDTLVSINPEKFNDKLQVNDFGELTDNTILMATNGNGVVFYQQNGKYIEVREEHGLTSSICNAIATDKDGVVWVATNKGLNKISGYPGDIRVEYYNTYDGLLTNEITDVLVSNDTVWVATKKGINFFNKAALIKRKVQPVIYIDNVTIRGKVISPEPQKGRLIFEHDENDIAIKYVSPLFNSIGAVMYRYKLHRESPWKYTTDPFVYLSELKWSDYEFVVAACGRSGIWSNEASLSFTIQKPFWRTSLFLGALVFLLLAVTWGVLFIYLRQHKAKMLWQQRIAVSELRTLRAQMNPHFLFNALNSMQELFLKKEVEKAQNYLGKFGKLMRSILDHSDRVTITIAEELESIKNYLDIERLRMNYKFNYKIEINPLVDIHTMEMPAMIIQPFIENSIWHGFTDAVKDAQLLVTFDLDRDNNIIINLKDNGIGRNASRLSKRTHHSRGMNLIKDRIDVLNFESKQKIELSIEDLGDTPGSHAGTLVKIKIPCL